VKCEGGDDDAETKKTFSLALRGLSLVCGILMLQHGRGADNETKGIPLFSLYAMAASEPAPGSVHSWTEDVQQQRWVKT